MNLWTYQQWRNNMRMTKATFTYVSEQVQDLLHKKNLDWLNMCTFTWPWPPVFAVNRDRSRAVGPVQTQKQDSAASDLQTANTCKHILRWLERNRFRSISEFLLPVWTAECDRERFATVSWHAVWTRASWGDARKPDSDRSQIFFRFFYQCEQPNAIANDSQPFPDMQSGHGLKVRIINAQSPLKTDRLVYSVIIIYASLKRNVIHFWESFWNYPKFWIYAGRWAVPSRV